MKIAVTTAGGQLGSTIIKSLITKVGNKNIVGIARTPSKVQQSDIEIRQGDYSSKSEFDKALTDIDVVMLVSGMDAPEKRIGQHRNVIMAAKEAGVKKIVYSSIIGKPGTSNFDAIVQSNRQTEGDIQKSGIDWVIGRNGLYIEPDVEYINQYKKEGKVANCAGTGLCSYTTRAELAYAYGQMILNDEHNGNIYNLCGEAITQNQLTAYLNSFFGTQLVYESMSNHEYLDLQRRMNGEFLGKIIAGIYTKIRNNEFYVDSHFEKAAGRKHIGWDEYFNTLI